MRRRASLPPPKTRKAILLAAGISLEEMGKAVGVSHEAIRLWEIGLRAPTETNLIRYSAVLEEMQRQLLSKPNGGDPKEVNP